MKLFGHSGDSKDGKTGGHPGAPSAEDSLKHNLAMEVEDLQKQFRQRQNELSTVTQKIQTVKDEYDSIVSSLMLIKKELNQKRMQVDAAEREYTQIQDKIKRIEQHAKDSRRADGVSEKNLSKTRHELKDTMREYDVIRERIAREQAALDEIRAKQEQARADLEAIRSAPPHGTAAAAGQDAQEGRGGGVPGAGVVDADAATDAAIPTATVTTADAPASDAGSKKNTAGIIEAASAIVGSLKSRLAATQKELEQVRSLLSEERAGHDKTRRELDDLRGAAGSASSHTTTTS